MSRFWLLGCLALTACIRGENSEIPRLSSRDEYVALGSSFAAGAAIGEIKEGTPQRCGRTINNYPTLLADQLDLVLEDQSCGGATTQHILNAWNELPPQIAAVDQTTRLVTVTIGGNDLNYVGNLVMSSCDLGEILKAGEYEIPCTKPVAPNKEAYLALENGLMEIVKQIRARSPKSHIVFVQYVSLVPDKLCDVASMTIEEARMNREIGLRLAEITARVASRTSTLLLEADRLSRQHTPCDPIPWANGMAKVIDLTHGAPWHPNAKGHRAIADALAEILTAKN